MNVKLASTTGDFLTLLSEDYLESVRRVAKAGFRYIDISFYNMTTDGPLMADDWKTYVDQMRMLEKALGVTYVQAHLPNANPLDEKSFDEYLARTIRAIEVCGMLGIRNAVIHVGWRAGITKEEFFALNRAALQPLFPTMEQYGVNVLVENSTRANMGEMYYFLTGSDMKEFLRYVDHPLLHACWDTGHANIEGGQYEHIHALGNDLRAVHVHDNLGDCDRHALPFTGTLNMDEVLNALMDIDYSGFFTFEADGAVSVGDGWLSHRREFVNDTRLFNPTLAIWDAAERFLYEIGKSCLVAYGIYEED